MPVADTDRRSLRKAEAQVETGKCYCCGLSTCLLCFCIQLFWAWALSLELKQASQAGCCAGCSHWEAHMGQPVLWETGTPTHKPAPAADSLAVGTLLNTKAPQFPHPLKKKKRHLSPSALFSVQGLCGLGRLDSRAWGACFALPSTQQEPTAVICMCTWQVTPACLWHI